MTSFLRGAPPPKKNPGSAPVATIKLLYNPRVNRVFTFIFTFTFTLFCLLAVVIVLGLAALFTLFQSIDNLINVSERIYSLHNRKLIGDTYLLVN